MAAISAIAREWADEIRDGIAWVIVWKTGRSWNAQAVWLNSDAELANKQQEAYTGAQRLGDVVELAKLMMKLMKDNKRRPADILQTVGEQLEQFGVSMPDSFYFSPFTTENTAERSNTVADFLSEFGSVVDKAVVEVYDAYLDYCRRTGNKPIPSTRGFGSEIVKQTGINAKPRHRNGKTVRVYID